MRILLLASTPFFSVRGTPLALSSLLQELSDKGWQVDVLTFPIGDDVDIPNVRLTRCGRWLGIRKIGFGPSWRKVLLDFAIFLEFLRRVVIDKLRKRRRYDVIHALDELAFGCWLVKPLIDVPVVYDMDSSIVEQVDASIKSATINRIADFIERKMIAVSSVAVPVCNSLADRVMEVDADKDIVILNDLSQFTPEDVDSAEESKYGLTSRLNSPIFMYVGNFASYQGTDLLLQAFEKHKNDGLPGSLIICGGSESEIDERIAKFPEATFLGTVHPSDLPPLFRVANWLVSPRLTGTNTPMKIYDYLCAGRPIIATDLPTHCQVLDESCALLVAPTERDLCRGLKIAADCDSRAAEMGKAGRDLWRRRYSHAAFSLKIDEIYRLALKGD